MSDGEKPAGMGAGKIVLIIVIVLFVLCAGCGIFAWVTGGTFIKGGVQLGMGTAEMQSALLKDVGPGTTVQILPDDDGSMILAIGVSGDVTEERAQELQDTAWKAYCKAFSSGGFKVAHVGIGQPSGANQVRGWRSHMVAADEVAQRTATPAPPISEMFTEIERMQREAEAERNAGGDEDGEEKDTK